MAHLSKIPTALFLFLLSSVGTSVFAFELDEATPITLVEALQIGGAENLSVALEEVEKRAAEISLDRVDAPFVPNVSFDTSFVRNSNFAGGENQFIRNSAGVFWLTPIGTQLGLTAQSIHVQEGSGGVPITEIGFDVSQPLLRGAWGSGNDRSATKYNEQIQRLLFVESLNAILDDIDAAYWNLVLAQFDVDITNRSVQRAKQQYDDTKANIEQGILAPGDIFVVEENHVFFQQQYLRAQESRVTASARLATLLNKDPRKELVATEKPLEFKSDIPPEPDFKDDPQVRAQMLRQTQAQTRLSQSKLNRLPSVDLRGSVSLGGIGSVSDAWAETFSADQPSFLVGLNVSTPLWFASLNADVESGELDVKRSQIGVESAGRRELEARYSIRTQLEARRSILALSQKRFELSEKKLETEIDKYKNGVSRLPEVVRFQRDVDSAELSVVRARIDVIRAGNRLVAEFALRHTQAGIEVK